MNPILWQNADQKVTLIDVPCSISAAQGTKELPFLDILISTKPLETPYPGNEPKSEKARAKLLGDNTVDTEWHQEFQQVAATALEQINLNYDIDWCLPRPCVQDRPKAAKKRKREEDAPCESEGIATSPIDLPHSLLPSLAKGGVTRAYGLELDDPTANNDLPDDQQSFTRLGLSNSAHPEKVFTFRIPPKSSFSLSNCQTPQYIHSAIRTQAQDLDTGRTFDFILLDPPWPNSSVKRTHKTPHSTYNTSSTLYDLRQLILGMDLDVLMAQDCLVGMWITNRPSVRELVLGEDGLFACWGVELVEEWMWLKTTIRGEPVGKLDSVWRKPYEALLLGRKRRCYSAGDGTGTAEMKRRVLCSVPDLHSRKPCLKSLIEPLMSDSSNYRALEVFARHLVAGWWSWGDECIKFNWEGYWQRPENVSHHENETT